MERAYQTLEGHITKLQKGDFKYSFHLIFSNILFFDQSFWKGPARCIVNCWLKYACVFSQDEDSPDPTPWRLSNTSAAEPAAKPDSTPTV